MYSGLRIGELLVAEPFMEDENFKRSVILVTEHDKEGTLGLILNKPSMFRVNEVIPSFTKKNIPLFIGGPVGMDRVNYIHAYGDMVPKSIPISENLYWNGDFEIVKKLINDNIILPHNIKFFIGYSSWDSDQFVMEMKENSWFISKNNEEIFRNHEYMWKRTLIQMGGKYKLFSDFPENPKLN
jgi:putative transcriptional regulator